MEVLDEEWEKNKMDLLILGISGFKVVGDSVRNMTLAEIEEALDSGHITFTRDMSIEEIREYYGEEISNKIKTKEE
jgi:hypothetical protein